MRVLTAVALLASLTAVAAADDDATGPKDPVAATVLATSATAVGLAGVGVSLGAMDRNAGSTAVVFAFGGTLAFAGPSFGHFYSGRRGSGGLILRASSLGVALVGLFVIAAECAEQEPCPGHLKGNAVLGGALAMFVGGTIWDLATAGS